MKKINIFIGLVIFTLAFPLGPQAQESASPLLTVRQVMTGIIEPATNTIWGAYQLQSDDEWMEVQNAALSVIGAGNLLTLGGAGEDEQAMAQESDWMRFNNEVISAAREVIAAVEARDEEALFNAGNDSLYPPCESCHQIYQEQ